MIRKLQLLVVFFMTTVSVLAQKKQFTLEEIWGGAFRMEYLDRLESLNNGTEYSVLNTDRSTGSRSIDVYSYETGKKVRTLVDSKDLEGLDGFSTYAFSADESKILLGTNVRPIFRRSTLGDYYVYDTKSKKLTQVAENPIQEPTFSPDATKVAYGQNNNLFYKNLI